MYICIYVCDTYTYKYIPIYIYIYIHIQYICSRQNCQDVKIRAEGWGSSEETTCLIPDVLGFLDVSIGMDLEREGDVAAPKRTVTYEASKELKGYICDKAKVIHTDTSDARTIAKTERQRFTHSQLIDLIWRSSENKSNPLSNSRVDPKRKQSRGPFRHKYLELESGLEPLSEDRRMLSSQALATSRACRSSQASASAFVGRDGSHKLLGSFAN